MKGGVNMEVRRAIVDECGSIVFWCDELEDGDTEDILELHPEWSTKCFEAGSISWLFY